MKFLLFFLFLFCIPFVSAVAVSPASVTFVDSSADIVLINDHSFPVSFFVYGAASEMIVDLAPLEKKIVSISHNSSADSFVRVREISSFSDGISVYPEVSISSDVEQSFVEKIASDFIAPFKEFDLSSFQLASLGLFGALLLVSLFVVIFSNKKVFKHPSKTKNQQWTSLKYQKNGRRNGRNLKSSR